MRLLKVSTVELENFRQDIPPVRKIPPYAILSHTWEGDEVTFEDFQNGTAETKPTWKKVLNACQRARKNGLEYVWIDSCCINKSKSAELDEAINSMYSYYEESVVCYTYLSDVPAACDPNQQGSAFRRSRWFTRGWTLQELLAPTEILFFSQDWTELGSKNTNKGNTLCTTLSEITHIDEDILMHRRSVHSASVAKRMSWAAHRETTRPEDIAYCLLGIFSVNMYLAYGEKSDGAFLRLQKIIVERINDHSIFAWKDHQASEDSLHGMLATSPSKFADCYDILPCLDWPTQPYSMTNLGLEIDLPMIEYQPGRSIAMLGCARTQSVGKSFVGIYLEQVTRDRRRHARIKLNQLVEFSGRGTIQTIHVPQNNFLPDMGSLPMDRAFELRQMPEGPYQITSAFAQTGTALTLHKTKHPLTFKIYKGLENHLQCCVTIEQNGGPSLLLMLGTMKESAVGFDAIDAYDPSIFDVDDFETIRNLYNPIEFGNWLKIQNHFVRVNAEIQVCRSHKYYVLDVKVHPVTGQQIWNKPSLVYLTSRPAIRPNRALLSMSKQTHSRWRVLVAIVTIAMVLVMVEVTRFCFEGRRQKIT